jgi:hypothetical protein
MTIALSAHTPLPSRVTSVPTMPEAGLSRVMEGRIQKVVVTNSNDEEAVRIVIPPVWVSIIKVAENVPFVLVIEVVIVWCVPKSIQTKVLRENPHPWTVISVPTMPSVDVSRRIDGRITKELIADSWKLVAVIVVVPPV